MQICSTCPAPSGLTNNSAADLIPCSYTGVQISWNIDPANWGDDGTGMRTYAVLRDGSAIAVDLPYGMTSYIDTSGINGQTYYYKVRYVNGCDAGAYTAGVQEADYPKPPTVMNTNADDKSPQFDTGIDISWPLPGSWGDQGANVSNRRFKVYRDATDISGLLPVSALTYEDSNGINNTYYTYHVDAINGCGVISSYNGMAAIDAVTQAIDWSRIYGGSNADFAYSIQQTSDGGYIVAGTTNSFGAGDNDFWILKLDSSGNVTWQKTYSGAYDDYAYSIQQTGDGGYIVAGDTYSFGAGDPDIWIVKLDSSGTITWQKTYGGTSWDEAHSVQQTADGGYIVAGSYSGDMWILKLDSSGTITWQKTYGGTNWDEAHSVQQTNDGGFIVAGEGNALNNVSVNDYWIIKLTSSGTITWQKTYGGSDNDYSYSIQQTSDGGYVVAGYTWSFGAGDADFWVLKLNPYGTMNSSCTFIEPTSISPVDSTISSADTNATDISTSCNVSDTGITGTNSNGYDFLLCDSTLFLKLYKDKKPLVIDTGSPTANGIIEPDELVVLAGTLENTGSTAAISITGLLTSIDSIIISNPDAAYPDIPSNDHRTCTTCYSLTAPYVPGEGGHRDFEVTETVSAVDFGPKSYHYIYHVGKSFSDVPPSYLFYPYIETLLHSGVTSACTNAVYCPANYVQRQQMAKFICASMEASHPGSCTAYYCNGIFDDVQSSNPFCSYIEQLYNSGIVAGCQTTPLLYCPDSALQRQALAKFVCLGMQSAKPGSCLTENCTGIFNDVPTTNPFCSYIEALYNASVISGCGANTYCPTAFVSRAQMSKFLVNGFHFEL